MLTIYLGSEFDYMARLRHFPVHIGRVTKMVPEVKEKEKTSVVGEGPVLPLRRSALTRRPAHSGGGYSLSCTAVEQREALKRHVG
jgi:hypothetical protein